jgi:hypothetical protein
MPEYGCLRLREQKSLESCLNIAGFQKSLLEYFNGQPLLEITAPAALKMKNWG